MADGPKTLRDWIEFLHAAAAARQAAQQAGQSDPEADEAVAFALQRIQRLNLAADVADQPKGPGPVAGAIGNVLHGASLGTGEVIAGLGGAATGRGFRQGAQGYRESLEEIEGANSPLATTALQTLAGVALPGGQIGRTATQSIKAGVPLGIRGAAQIVGKGALIGGVTGGLQGFSTGGEDPGDVGARFASAGQGAKYGALAGGLFAGLGIPLARRNVERAADLTHKGQQRENTRLAGEILRRRLNDETTPPPRSAAGEQRLRGDVYDQLAQAREDLAAGRITEEDFNTAMELAVAQRGPAPTKTVPPEYGTTRYSSDDPAVQAQYAPRPTPAEAPEFGTMMRAYLDPKATAAQRFSLFDVAPPTSSQAGDVQVVQRALESPRNQPRPGHPIYYGSKAPTRSAETRRGERLLPKAKEPLSPAVNLGAADGYLRAGNTSQLDRFDPGELAARLESLPNIGPTQRARVLAYLSRKLGTPPARGSLP